jgi:hypothetical protein
MLPNETPRNDRALIYRLLCEASAASRHVRVTTVSRWGNLQRFFRKIQARLKPVFKSFVFPASKQSLEGRDSLEGL